MTKLTLDAATAAKLDGLTGPIALYDEGGRLVAVCVPPTHPTVPVSPPPTDKCFPFDEAEIAATRAAILANPGLGKPLDQILREAGYL